MWRCVIVLSPLTAPQNRTASASSVGAPQAQAQASCIRHIHTKPRLASPRHALPRSPACCSLNKRSNPATLTRKAPLHQQAAHDFLGANQAAYDTRGQSFPPPSIRTTTMFRAQSNLFDDAVVKARR